MRHVAEYMTEKTGWTIKPVKGFVSARDFLEGMAERVFCSTFFIREEREIYFSALPDYIHEVIGHCIPLMSPKIAHLSQLIGKSAFGANDKQIEDIGKLDWFTLEIGLVKENG